MRKRPLLLIGLAFCLVAGCAISNGARLTRKESVSITSLARKKLMDAYPGLDATAKNSLDRPADSFSYYCLGGDCFQYFITWKVNSNRFASVYGTGNLRQLENARVILRSLPLDQGNLDKN